MAKCYKKVTINRIYVLKMNNGFVAITTITYII